MVRNERIKVVRDYLSNTDREKIVEASARLCARAASVLATYYRAVARAEAIEERHAYEAAMEQASADYDRFMRVHELEYDKVMDAIPAWKTIRDEAKRKALLGEP